jgi:DNA-binding NarL/FixJ family response regulator
MRVSTYPDNTLEKITLLIADDHAVLRAGLRALINVQADMEVIAEAKDGTEAVVIAGQTHPDVVLMDLTMPKGGGISAITSIRQAYPRSRVLALTMHDDPSYLHAVLIAGGAGYVVKTAADTELLTAIRVVMQGGTFVDMSTKQQDPPFAPDRNKSHDEPIQDGSIHLLSPREREVLIMVSQGHTNQEVADRLKLSVKSVETYRARLMEKLLLKNRADLVRFALNSGLLAPEQSNAKI